MTGRHFFRPGEHRPLLAHDPLNSIVGPRPIGWISSLSPEGIANLAPYSFFNAFNYQPPIVGFASVGWKDSIANIEATGEFAWNLATEELAEAMNATSAMAGPGIDEFELAGLAKAEARHIAVPLVAASPVSFECRLSQIVRLQSAEGRPIETWVAFGEVVGMHVAPRVIVDGNYATDVARPILRAGGAGEYFSLDPAKRFTMLRP
ncbi:MAG: flavin reductase family protein [Candidatus Andeanibacterium colombiense]|uniref:Flavin reductase family protein n=1 Tax=Candidatus Andeanibacterium colombiense TaxID=3121345 RepID=A0AAJ5X8J7_9SPHN|nr:MAG: flavin reductase family protein [Sphingomonadaceae bacterium]